MAQIKVRVTPKASRNTVKVEESAIKVYVSAPPADGEANQAVIDTLAKALGVSRSRVTLIRGQTSREKTVDIENLSEAEIMSRLIQ